MKKTLLLFIFILVSTFLYAQQLPLLSKDGNSEEKSKKLTFEETTKNLETYFSTRDVNKKGSGYKPFKRWEYHWSHYLQTDPAKRIRFRLVYCLNYYRTCSVHFRFCVGFYRA